MRLSYRCRGLWCLSGAWADIEDSSIQTELADQRSRMKIRIDSLTMSPR